MMIDNDAKMGDDYELNDFDNCAMVAQNDALSAFNGEHVFERNKLYSVLYQCLNWSVSIYLFGFSNIKSNRPCPSLMMSDLPTIHYLERELSPNRYRHPP